MLQSGREGVYSHRMSKFGRGIFFAFILLHTVGHILVGKISNFENVVMAMDELLFADDIVVVVDVDVVVVIVVVVVHNQKSFECNLCKARYLRYL